jgi:hypothetical protein
LFRRRLLAIALLCATAGLLPVVQAPQAQAVVNNDTLVQAWYRQFLGRTPEAAAGDSGRYYWVGKLDQGQRPSDLLWQITHSREYVEREVSAYYNDLLGRAPDPGAAYWIDNAAYRGMNLEWVYQNISASQEFYDAWYTKEWVVDDWYSGMLGRYNVSAGEQSYWLNRARQVGRLQAVREIYYSDEAIRYRVNEHYKDILYRFDGADFSGLSYWYPKEIENDVNVQVLLASTAEFVQRRVY